MVLVAQLEHQYKGVSLMFERFSRPGICYSHNTIVTAGASVQSGESFMSERISRPGICHLHDIIRTAGASVFHS